jgi:hypothetical protein
MLTRIKRDLSFRSRGAVGMPTPRALLGSSTFPGLYMRPNPGDDGSVPAADPYCASPDIWIAGLDPVANFQTALATDQSYASESSNNVFSGQGNLIYVRGRNGATADKTVNVSMYYAPSGVIQSPSKWQNNVIPTDQGPAQGTLANVAPGTVGVCDATFLWSDPPPPPPGSDHYCLFAQFNDAANSNPFPDVETVFDMGALIMNNLGWGWRNTSMIPSTATWQMSEPLAIPANYPTQSYQIAVTPVGFVGWDVDFHCSQPDANGNLISLARTTIVQDKQILGVSAALLEGGFQGQMFVNLYSPNGQGAPVGATVPLSCNYIATSKKDVREAVSRGLVDWEYMWRLRRSNPELFVGPTAMIGQGAYSAKVSDSPAVLAWWEQRGLSLPQGRRR